MGPHRKGEEGNKNFFRNERFFKTNGEWFFDTREGVEGPFSNYDKAFTALERYKVNMKGIDVTGESYWNAGFIKKKEHN